MSDTNAAAIPLPLAPPRTFFGEPRALGYLAFTEAWERFSYYGMTALLVLYMSQTLFLPGHIEQVAGFAAFRAGLESVFGRMSTIALASQIFGLYTGFVYFTPVFGGLIADRFLGRRNAVALGAVLMSGGHIAMAFDASFLLALVLLIVGCGFLKGNISRRSAHSIPRAIPPAAPAASPSSPWASTWARWLGRWSADCWRSFTAGTRASDWPAC